MTQVFSLIIIPEIIFIVYQNNWFFLASVLCMADEHKVKQIQEDLCSNSSLCEVYESASFIIQMCVQELILLGSEKNVSQIAITI